MTRKTVKLLKSVVERAKHQGSGDRTRLWDSEVKNFHLDVHSSGRKVFLVKYRNAQGVERRATIGASDVWTVEEARKEARRILALVDQGEDPQADKQAARARQASTLADFWPKYREHAVAGWKPSTAALNDWHWSKSLAPALGNKSLASLNVGDVDAWHRELVKRAPGNARVALRLLRAVLNHAVQLDALKANPAARVKALKERKRERFLDAAELAALWDAIADEERLGGLASVQRVALPADDTTTPRRKNGRPDKRHAPEMKGRGISPWAAGLFRLLILTGARLREVMACRWEWVNEGAQFLDLPDSKSGAKRVPLNDAALVVLAELRSKRTASNPFVIEGQVPGRPMNNAARPWARVLTRAAAILNERRLAAGLDTIAHPFDGLRIHDLRHSWASTGAMLGLPLLTLGKALGHAQARTTERYAHLNQDPALIASNRVGAAIVDAVNRPAAVVENIAKAKA